MGMYINHEMLNTERYRIYNLKFYMRGDLKGYAQGMIEFNNGRGHEFLYRVYDPENGDSKTMVSIDWGFKNPMVDELWDEIENNLTKIISNSIVIGSEEDLNFWKVCKDNL